MGVDVGRCRDLAGHAGRDRISPVRLAVPADIRLVPHCPPVTEGLLGLKLECRLNANDSMRHTFARKYDLLFQSQDSVFGGVEPTIQPSNELSNECPPKYLMVDLMFFQFRSPKHFELIGESGQAFEGATHRLVRKTSAYFRPSYLSGCTIVAQMVPNRVVLHKHRASHPNVSH
jgi:hypothetical protein